MHVLARAALGGAFLVGLPACQSTRPPTAPSNAAIDSTIVRVVLGAPTTLAPGAVTQLTLTGVDANGAEADVTSRATFSGGYDVVETSATGRVAALKIGTARVTGAIGLVQDTRELVVVPAGTFRLQGRVVDADRPSAPVRAAQIAVDGELRATTDFAGEFLFYGAPSRTRLRVSKPGYVTAELVLELADNHTQTIALVYPGPRLDLAGSYRLSIDAAPECRSSLPESLRTRHYTVATTQIGPTVNLALSGGEFINNSLYAVPPGTTVVDADIDQPGNALVLDVSSPGHCEFTNVLVEKVPEGYFEIDGAIRVTPDGGGFAGALRGSLTLLGNPQCSHAVVTPLAGCQSRSHRVTLTR
jgi:hypothetical protein